MDRINQKIEVVLNNLYHLIQKGLLFLVLFYNTETLLAQRELTGKVEYLITYDENFDARKIFDNPKLKQFGEVKKAKILSSMMQTANFELLFNGKEAVYKIKDSEKGMKVDTKRKGKISFLRTFGGGDNVYYTDMKKKELLTQNNSMLLEKIYLLSDDLPKWSITQQTKKIGKYICYKAIKINNKKNKKGKPIEAWFTPDIPVGFGPEKSIGLPGLILEVHRGSIVLIATKIVLNPKEKLKIKKPEKGIKIKSKEYRKKVIEMSKRNGFGLK